MLSKGLNPKSWEWHLIRQYKFAFVKHISEYVSFEFRKFRVDARLCASCVMHRSLVLPGVSYDPYRSPRWRIRLSTSLV